MSKPLSSHVTVPLPQAMWNRIWTCRTLLKIKSFLWKAVGGALATGMALSKRKIPLEPSCPRCGAASETIEHIILANPFAKAVWFGSHLALNPYQSQSLSVPEWIMNWSSLLILGKEESRKDMSLCSFIAWNIWKARNELVFSSKAGSPYEVLFNPQQAHSELFTLRGSPPTCNHGVRNAPDLPLYWKPPISPTFKLNTDAALTFKKDKGDLGFVMRDHSSNMVYASSEPNSFTSMLLGEGLAIRLGMIQAIGEYIDHLEVESDSKKMISFIQDPSRNALADISPVVNDISHLSSFFRSISFSYIPREINSVADSLARKALSILCRIDWPHSTPWLQEVCLSDALALTHLFQ
ncbi:uncharacterized protein LOC122653841 [Telopea speciosissima]|uniref:uncharacterized protein LOC122653841 n=1 Tax=Telopea speciosissima TaxID=54955 RepID=UPI001CC70414|nr:uncharacterized protein LOC122653841 [Telopea speciosissima]